MCMVVLACSHLFLVGLFRPKTGLDVYSSLEPGSTPSFGPISRSSSHELSWTILDLHRTPPPGRCCNHCNPHLLNLPRFKPSNSRDPRILRYASEFIHSLPLPPSRPPSPAESILSNASQDTVELRPLKMSQTISKADQDSLRLRLTDWRTHKHLRMGESHFISPEVFLPPRQLEKIVNSAAILLSDDILTAKQVQKVVTWDMASLSDVQEVADVISAWRITLASTSPQKRTKKRRGTDAPRPIPQPIFSQQPEAMPSNSHSRVSTENANENIFNSPSASRPLGTASGSSMSQTPRSNITSLVTPSHFYSQNNSLLTPRAPFSYLPPSASSSSSTSSNYSEFWANLSAQHTTPLRSRLPN